MAYFKKVSPDSLLFPMGIGAALYHTLAAITLWRVMISPERIKEWKLPEKDQPKFKAITGFHSVMSVLFVRWVVKKLFSPSSWKKVEGR
jgi:hypothetical protein